MRYASLHNHTDYSNLRLVDSINRVETLIDYAVELGLSGVAITEHDCIGGHVRAWNYYNSLPEDKRAQTKLILGNEIYLCREGLTSSTHQKGEPFYHLILLALDDIGHQQIRELSARAWSRAYVMGIQRVPTYSSDLWDIVGSNPGHVIASTACLGGYCGKKYVAGEYEEIDNHLRSMQELFGVGNFFIELQPPTAAQKDQINYNQYMIDHYWNVYPFWCATDSHYLSPKERPIHKIFLNSKSSGDREVDSFYASAYMMSEDDLIEHFAAQHQEHELQTMMTNTIAVMERVEGYHFKNTSVIPHIQYTAAPIDERYFQLCKNYPSRTQYLQTVIAANKDADIHLLNLCIEPFWKKHQDDDFEQYVVELDYEFEQLWKISNDLKQSMSDYFITMAKMIDIMWNEAGSLVGPARGSAGSSLINYFLGITQIDPLKQPLELPFWR